MAAGEQMDHRMLKRKATTTGEVKPSDAKNAVRHNTAARRLEQIADFLKWYFVKVLSVRMPLESDMLSKLEASYTHCCDDLKDWIRSTNTSHPDQLRSLPVDRHLAVYRKVFLEPHEVFRAPSGERSSTLLRDRAIVLLGAEGLRPGAIGNIQLSDFAWKHSSSNGQLALADNASKRGRPVTTATPVQKGIRSPGYRSAYVMDLWPTTCAAIEDYKRSERNAIVSKTLTNQSKGFLFLAEHGGPIGNRTTISAVFSRARKALSAAGLLVKNSKEGQSSSGESYAFTCYTLRHSAASAYYEWNRDKKDVGALMKQRFGWNDDSQMPSLYAARAIRDAAAPAINEWVDSLFRDQKQLRGER